MFLSLVLLVSSVATCSGENGSVVVEDGLGRTVSVPADVDGIVGLEAGALRLLTYLKATEAVVGVEDFEKRDCKRPYRLAHPELADLPSVGPMHGGDPELIVAARPDLIFWTYTSRKKARDLQNKTGIPVVGLEYGGTAETKRNALYSTLRLMGKILDKEERAEEVIAFMKNEISTLRENGENSRGPGPTAYVGGVGHRGIQGIVSTEPSYPPFEFLGVRNAAGELGLDHATINEEKLLQWDPDYLFIDEAGLSLVKENLKQPQYRALSAVESGEIYRLLPYNYYTTNYGTVLADAYFIGKLIYPGRFEGVDPEAKADRIYEFLVGEPIYTEMAEIFGGFGRIELGG